MERLWYTAIPSGNDVSSTSAWDTTNRNVMDAFAGVAIPGRQWNFRARESCA